MGKTRRSAKSRSNGIRNHRFLPHKLYGDDIDLDTVERYKNEWVYITCWHTACPNCGVRETHDTSIVIAVDGARRRNGLEDARGAVGVFVGNNSPYNTGFEEDMGQATNQKAELMAGIVGLERALDIYRHNVDGEELESVVIKADSEYLVRGITEWVPRWRENGYLTVKGTPVSNENLFRQFHEMLTMLEGFGIEVLFWHVPRARNSEADALAKSALR